MWLMDREAVMSFFLILSIKTGLDHLSSVWRLTAKMWTSAWNENNWGTDPDFMPQLHSPSAYHTDELSGANSQPTPSVRVQSPTDDKAAPRQNQLPHIIDLCLKILSWSRELSLIPLCC